MQNEQVVEVEVEEQQQEIVELSLTDLQWVGGGSVIIDIG